MVQYHFTFFTFCFKNKFTKILKCLSLSETDIICIYYMCWSASVSLNTFIFSIFSVCFAYFNNIIGLTNSLLFGLYASIQLLEYFVWSNTFSNKLISKIALCVILVQPFLAILCITNKSKLHYIPILLGLYSIFVISIFAFFKPWNTIDFRMIPSKQTKHLSWLWLDFPWYVTIIWLIFLIYPSYLNEFWLGVIFLIGTVGYSYVMFALVFIAALLY